MRRTYIDGHNTGRILNINRCIWEELDFVVVACFKLEQNLFLSNFSEVEFAPIEGLQDLINTKLSWPLLKVTTLVQLRNEAILSRNNLHEQTSA